MDKFDIAQQETNKWFDRLEINQQKINQRLDKVEGNLENSKHSPNQMVDLLHMIADNTKPRD